MCGKGFIGEMGNANRLIENGEWDAQEEPSQPHRVNIRVNRTGRVSWCFESMPCNHVGLYPVNHIGLYQG